MVWIIPQTPTVCIEIQKWSHEVVKYAVNIGRVSVFEIHVYTTYS